MNKNIVSWFEIYVTDMPRAKKFYEAVFNTQLEKLETEGMEYQMFPYQEGGEGSGGALVKMAGVPVGAGGTMVYLSCEDCAVEESRIVPNGGEILKEKFAIGENGFISIAKDSEGNVIGLHSMK
ncbi:TPA: VOC family protein [Serratia fonticola]|jgi:predicted enzyme related to lactoylglutathione lyase|uniref:VOC family protein n=1 Tax=Serratia fonticola TaxID=47917 RepID=UPI000FB6D57F|nr:VOC family protein [Serratia fonticola]MBL5826387.1 VOC family protein [Serratia fonticola]CAI1020554.1 Predicted enzyme related to lactoylglutathione lyase [Serratia fonticola]CAI1179109.1 Predicted enzyme related to lactoylglutathione lyase [Serratia fonticola]CAI2509166.1 Predicted enzyme related to lactoylglutathione lyase [Serratia fonticola]